MAANSNPEDISFQNIRLKSTNGDVVNILPYGAHVLSWVTSDGSEHLFLSPKAEFQRGVAIRGGVPVIFPQFSGMGKLPKHGFARTQTWEIATIKNDSAIFRLSETENTRSIWPHRFLAEFEIRIDNSSLEMLLSVLNIDSEPFTFTVALHTYLQVKKAAQAALFGLKGTLYRDSKNADKEVHEESERVIFQNEVDRIYFDVPNSLELVEGNQHLIINTEGFRDVVTWNPGREKCALLKDMEPDGYQRFVCVEPACIGQPISLDPGEKWFGKQSLSV